jgi:phosphoribosyl 1,2-cyclic phosphate phosphodiesterase
MKLKKVTLLGCGSSMGVPVVGCSCHVCHSQHPYNRRLRSSLLLEDDFGAWLVDVGPDFREQALRKKIPSSGKGSLHGVIITHAHSDHVAGLDELRIFNFGQSRSLPIILSEACYKDLARRFYYMFEPAHAHQNASASLRPYVLSYLQGKMHLDGLEFSYSTHYQGGMPVLGIRIGSFAYFTDIKDYGPELIEHARGVDTLIMSGGGLRSIRMHMDLLESIELAKQIGARRTIFTHMDHDIDYEHWENRLPQGMSLGYDGMEIDLR